MRCETCHVDPEAMRRGILRRIFDILAQSGLRPSDFMPLIGFLNKKIEEDE